MLISNQKYLLSRKIISFDFLQKLVEVLIRCCGGWQSNLHCIMVKERIEINMLSLPLISLTVIKWIVEISNFFYIVLNLTFSFYCMTLVYS